jgi:hypothetical protein
VQAILFDVFDQKQREKQISQADVVISMLPTVYHIHVARACMRFNKHLLHGFVRFLRDPRTQHRSHPQEPAHPHGNGP